jgi:hypothetical protein
LTIKKITANGKSISVVTSDAVCISDGQTALDFFMSMYYETGDHAIVINKETLTEDFFVLSTKVAGDVLQKMINYKFKLAVVGDFTGYASKPLNDFIYESNKGKDIFFVSTVDEAVERLSKVL